MLFDHAAPGMLNCVLRTSLLPVVAGAIGKTMVKTPAACQAEL